MAGFQDRNLGYRDLTIQANVWDAILFALIDGVSSMCIAGILWYGASDALSDVMTIGLLAGFLDYIGRLFRPIREFSGKLAIIQRATSALEKIFSLLDEGDEIASGPLEVEPGSVRIKDLRFAYFEGEPILKGVDLHIEPGEVVAVVGRTGSGKSTLSKLLSRAYQGYDGTIHIGDTELGDAKLDSLRRVVGVVHQDVHLFAETVVFNLTLGNESARGKLQEAIALCHAESTIERLGGLDGHIAERGGNLSAGEAQLLAFTRTLAFDTPIVILDEATSSVDSITEARLQQATEALLSTKTVLVIAHRLSTIMRADRILVMDDGRVIERGNHEALMAKGGTYADLFHKQFAPEEAEA
jgi:ATP-binding cassette subfamily B protein